MKKSLVKSCLVLGSVLLLAGCLVPQKFTTHIRFEVNGGYSYQFAGTAINALAVKQQQQSGRLTESEQRDLANEPAKLLKNPDVKKAEHLGEGRYALESAGSRKAGQPLRLFDFFMVTTDKKTGVTTIAAAEIKDSDKAQLKQLGMSVKGTLDVKLPANAEVISHNATASPTADVGSYVWQIDGVNERPVMQIRFRK